VDSAPNAAAYRWIQERTRRLGVEAIKRFVSSFGNYDSPQNAFLSGRVAMEVQGPWLANVVGAFRPDLDYGVAPVPVAANEYQRMHRLR
jgi:maltose-binding protein MalE